MLMGWRIGSTTTAWF